MRRNGLVLTFVVLTALGLSFAVRAQQPQSPPPAAQPSENDKKLDGFLQQWAAKMQEIKTLRAELERKEKDKTFKTEETYTGFAEYLKTGTGATAENRARFEMKVKGKQDVHEKVIVTPSFFYQYKPASKVITATEIPKAKAGEPNQDSFMMLVFGGAPADLRTRYDLKLSTDAPHPQGVDQYYIYVDVFPKSAADKADFQRAQLVLDKSNFLPRRLWFETPNKSEIMWDIMKIDDKPKLNPRDFDAPTPEPGWKFETVDPKSPAPKIIRGSEK